MNSVDIEFILFIYFLFNKVILLIKKTILSKILNSWNFQKVGIGLFHLELSRLPSVIGESNLSWKSDFDKMFKLILYNIILKSFIKSVLYHVIDYHN